MNTLKTHQKSIGIALISLLIGVGIGYASAGNRFSRLSTYQDQDIRGAGFAENFDGTQGGMMRGGTRGGANGLLSGVVSTIGGTSITLMTPNGSSKVILFTPSTYISKSVDSTYTDITTGASVTVTGVTNSDGSITATQLQIRPRELVAPGAN